MRKVVRNLARVKPCAIAPLLVCLLVSTASKAEPTPKSPPNVAREPRKTSLDPFVFAGGSVRIDDAPLFQVNQRIGANFGFGFAYQFQPIAIGLSYEYTDLGRENSGIGPYGFVDISRTLDTIWAQLRVRLPGPTWGTPFFGVGMGATWQQARTRGIVLLDQGVSGGMKFGCSAQDSMNIALRFGGGIEIPIGNNISFVADGAFDAYRLSSEIIEFCAPGAGGTTAFLLRGGITYHYDLAEGGKSK